MISIVILFKKKEKSNPILKALSSFFFLHHLGISGERRRQEPSRIQSRSTSARRRITTALAALSPPGMGEFTTVPYHFPVNLYYPSCPSLPKIITWYNTVTASFRLLLLLGSLQHWDLGRPGWLSFDTECIPPWWDPSVSNSLSSTPWGNKNGSRRRTRWCEAQEQTRRLSKTIYLISLNGLFNEEM